MSKTPKSMQVHSPEHKFKKGTKRPSFCIFNPRTQQIRRLQRIRRLVKLMKRQTKKKQTAEKGHRPVPPASEGVELKAGVRHRALQDSGPTPRGKKRCLPLSCGDLTQQVPKADGLNANLSCTYGFPTAQVFQRKLQTPRRKCLYNFPSPRLRVNELSELVKTAIEFRNVLFGDVDPLGRAGGEAEAQNHEIRSEVTNGCSGLRNVDKETSPIPFNTGSRIPNISNTHETRSTCSVQSARRTNRKNICSEFAKEAEAYDNTDDDRDGEKLKMSSDTSTVQFVQKILSVLGPDSVPPRFTKRDMAHRSKTQSQIRKQTQTEKRKEAKKGMNVVIKRKMKNGVPQYIIVERVYLKCATSDSALEGSNTDGDKGHHRGGIHKRSSHQDHKLNNELEKLGTLWRDNNPGKPLGDVYVLVDRPNLETCSMIEKRRNEAFHLNHNPHNETKQLPDYMDDDWQESSADDSEVASLVNVSENNDEQNLTNTDTSSRQSSNHYRHSEALRLLNISPCSCLQTAKQHSCSGKGKRHHQGVPTNRDNLPASCTRTHSTLKNATEHFNFKSKGTQTCNCPKCNAVNECDRYVGSIRTSRITTSSSRAFCYCPGIQNDCNIVCKKCNPHSQECDICPKAVAFSSTSRKIVSTSQEVLRLETPPPVNPYIQTIDFNRALEKKAECKYSMLPQEVNDVSEQAQSGEVTTKMHLPLIEINEGDTPYLPKVHRTVEKISVQQLLDDEKMQLSGESKPWTLASSRMMINGMGTSNVVYQATSMGQQLCQKLSGEKEAEDNEASFHQSQTKTCAVQVDTTDLSIPQFGTTESSCMPSKIKLKQDAAKSLANPRSQQSCTPTSLKSIPKSKSRRHTSRIPVIQFNYSRSRPVSLTSMNPGSPSPLKDDWGDKAGDGTAVETNPPVALGRVDDSKSKTSGSKDTIIGSAPDETDEFLKKIMKSMWRFVTFSKSMDPKPEETLSTEDSQPKTANASCSNTNLLLPEAWVSAPGKCCTSSIPTVRARRKAF